MGLRFGALLLLGFWLATTCALAQDEQARPRAILTIKPDGSDVRLVTHVPGFTWLGSPRWSRDGKRLVLDARNAQSDANRMFIVNADGSNLTEFGPGSRGDWSPDDKQIAFAAGTNSSLPQGIHVQNVDGRGRQHLGIGLAPHWSPDGGQLALQSGALHLLDLADGNRRPLFDPKDKVHSAEPDFDWSPDGKQLAVVVKRIGEGFDLRDHQLVIVDARGSQFGFHTRLEGQIGGVAWSPDGKTLAVPILEILAGGNKGHRLYLVDVEGDDPPRLIPGQQGDNREPAWSPDGKLLAFASSRPMAAKKMAAAPESGVSLVLEKNYDFGGTCYDLAVSPDGRTALLGANMQSRQMQLWNIQGTTAQQIPMMGIFVALAPDGQRAACAERTKMSVTYFNLQDGKPIRQFPSSGMATFIEFSADGRRLACGGQGGTVIVYDLASGQELARRKYRAPIGSGAISPDGQLMATSAADNKVYLWNIDTAATVGELDHPALVWRVAFSPDGRYLATGTGGTPTGDISAQRVPVAMDNAIRLWDVASSKLVRTMDGHTHAVAALAFSPDGRRLASGSFDGTLRLWDVQRGVTLAQAPGKSWIFEVAFSSDAQTILTCGGNLRENPLAPLVDVPNERVRVYRISTGPAQPN